MSRNNSRRTPSPDTSAATTGVYWCTPREKLPYFHIDALNRDIIIEKSDYLYLFPKFISLRFSFNYSLFMFFHMLTQCLYKNFNRHFHSNTAGSDVLTSVSVTAEFPSSFQRNATDSDYYITLAP